MAGHVAWSRAGVAVSGTFMGRDTAAGLAYVKTQAGHVGFTQPADLRRQLAGIAPGTWITVTYYGEHDGRKVFEVTVQSPQLSVPRA